MPTLVARRGVLDYARRPLNLVLLVVVPVVIVFVWGASLADFSKLLGGDGDGRQIEAATAGWAAAALAGLAGFFQTTGSRGADKRLAAAGGGARRVIAGRLAASFALALLAATGALVALAVRTGINAPVRVVLATVAIAVIYLAMGALVGTLVRTEMNGALVVTLIWVFDVILGPAMGPGTSPALRVLPLHFPTLVLTGQASGHAGPAGDVGWSVLWAAGLTAVAVARLINITRPAGSPTAESKRTRQADEISTSADVVLAPSPTRTIRPQFAITIGGGRPLRAVLRAGIREHRRNRVLWVLLVAVPALFIGLSVATTVDTPGPVTLREGATRFTAMLSERRMHAATMVPVTAAFLAGIAGLFVVTGSAGADRRLVQAGMRCRQVFAGRLGVIAAATVLTTTAAVAVSGALYAPEQWAAFAAANLLIALTYAMVGVLVGPVTGRLGGLYLVLLLAFIDVGLGQTVMLPGGPPDWGAYLPARGASRLLIDGAFTRQLDELGAVALALGWLAALSAVTALVFHRRTGGTRIDRAKGPTR